MITGESHQGQRLLAGWPLSNAQTTEGVKPQYAGTCIGSGA